MANDDADEMVRVKASDLREGDLVDLEGGEFFQDNPVIEFELATVAGVVRETDNCILVDFEGIGAAGYDPDHSFRILTRE